MIDRKCEGTLVWFDCTMPTEPDSEERHGGILECGRCGYFQCTGNFFHPSHEGCDFIFEGLS